ncbi:hypothetical protein [Spongiactinospora sp. TRM90649]|uniref:hypothetical protein n=1 Tax=Spongiactinospora sp. TRM90649 TaxID=3031114 RepID=UPI0023F66CCB|nr:hypothetical protein [Spongiactinospora sp. TRM90649]MDF5753853.1 hypothetical protein [Spongiactinospora sp. TRM90649]
MRFHAVNEDSRLSLWLRVREFAVPPAMIEKATARRAVGDWAGACAAAGVDVDLNPRSAVHVHGQGLVARVRADLRHLAPDLLRWHMPRIAPDGLLRPGLTISLARYDPEEPGRRGAVHLVARTPPAWADAGQRISLALWDGRRPGRAGHPHPRPHRRFRLDLHRHLWDVRRCDELRVRSGAEGRPPPDPGVPAEPGWAVDRWAAEALILLRAEGRSGGPVAVRLGGRRQLLLEAADPDASVVTVRWATARGGTEAPVLPDAATWVPPDLALLRAGLIGPGRLHPLVAASLVPGSSPTGPTQASEDGDGTRLVECRGAVHRIGLVDGVLAPLDHDPDEIRRERLLAALTGTPLPCLQAVEEAHVAPECLTDVRARLDHGDPAGALDMVEALIGPGAPLPRGALREQLETAARRRITHGLFRAGLAHLGQGPDPRPDRTPRGERARPRHAKRR